MSPYIALPGGTYIIAAFVIAYCFFTSNPALTIASIVSLLAFVRLLWRPGEPPILVFAVWFQMLQVTSKVFHANFLGLPVQHLSPFPTVEYAIWLGIAGMWMLVLGIRVVLSKLGPRYENVAREQAYMLSINRVAVLYAVAAVVATIVAAQASSFPNIRQILLTLVGFKWIAFFVLGYVILIRKEKYSFLLAAAAFEFVSGIGFFSGFKIVLFVLVIVLFTARVRVSVSNMGTACALGISLLFLGLAWTAVKPEYRRFVQQGSTYQVVRVSDGEKMAKLAELVAGLRGSDLIDAADPLFRRLAYVDYFAAAVGYVPEVRPHEGGALWRGSVEHVLRPRILFPEKPNLPSDSELTMVYTGLNLASADRGTSISIGYMGESYIDFGVPGMFLPVFILGLLWGGIYLFFLRYDDRRVFGYAFAMSVLLTAYQFEMASIKLVGGVLLDFVVLGSVFYYLVPKLQRWLQAETTSPLVMRPAARVSVA